MLSMVSLVLLCLGLVDATSELMSTKKVVQLPIRKHSKYDRGTQTVTKRDAISGVLINNLKEAGYFMNITIGTPGQLLEVLVDSGSADLWVHNDAACAAVNCFGGAYNMSESSTAVFVSDLFNISYGTPNSGVAGEYIEDTVQFYSTKLSNMTLAVADISKQAKFGILGVGPDVEESWVINNSSHKPYMNFIDTLVYENKISSRAYSMYLDDLEASTGQMIFGGYDRAKYTGELYDLPLQPNSNGEITDFTVQLTGLELQVDNASQRLNITGGSSMDVLLDSGTAFLQLPSAWYGELFDYFEAEQLDSGNVIVDCSILSSSPGTLNFEFGNLTIKLPYSQLAIPGVLSGVTMSNGNEACVLALTEEQAGLFILGDTFLRSAYIVYNIDNKVVGMAQTIFNTSDSDIQEIGSSGDNGNKVTQSTLTQTATAPVGEGTPTAASIVSVSATLTGALTTATDTSPSSTDTSSPTSAANEIFSELRSILITMTAVSYMVTVSVF